MGCSRTTVSPTARQPQTGWIGESAAEGRKYLEGEGEGDDEARSTLKLEQLQADPARLRAWPAVDQDWQSATLTGILHSYRPWPASRHAGLSRKRDWHSAANPSTFSRRVSSGGERASAESQSRQRLGPACLDASHGRCECPRPSAGPPPPPLILSSSCSSGSSLSATAVMSAATPGVAV